MRLNCWKWQFINLTRVALPLIGVALLTAISACGDNNRTANKLAEDSSAAKDTKSSLVFNDVTLEQVDEKGRLLWKVQAQQASYSRDEKIANVQNPTGELYQDGELVFRVTAQKGEVWQDGKQILLKGKIVATDVRDGAVLEGKELEWRPEEDILVVRNNLTGTHPQVQASAKEARMYSRTRRMELEGDVVANTNSPQLQLRTQKLLWQIKEQKVIGNVPVEIDRYQDEQVIQQATANTAEVDLAAKTATLKQAVEIVSSEPPMEVTSEEVTWNLENDIVASNRAVNVVHSQQQVTLTGDRGRVDLEQQVAYLNGNVRGIGEQNQSELGADRITWYFPTQEMEAEGNVTYQQVDPPLNLQGAKAFGKLQDQTIVVSSGDRVGRVETVINP